jgi:hypothetical protein
LADEDTGIGFLVQDFDADGCEGGGNEEHPEYPAPSSSFADEPTADGADHWAEKRTHPIDGGCHSSLLAWKEICNDASANGQAARTSNACEEAE